MECPKCGIEIDDNVLVCPNCKKVLKLECPICHTINKSNTCHKCGYIIISKCHQCGKINPTITGKCPKCGFDTHVSAILQDSNIDEFACVSIKIPNLKDLIPIFGSKKLYEKFKDKLNGLIYDYVKSIGLKRGLIGDTYIIRFNKDYTYASSVKNAVKSSIQLLNLITQLNYKLTKQKDVMLKCNIAILKRDAYSSNDDYKSGVNINLIYQQNENNNRLLSNLQVIADGSVYEHVGTTYPMESIGITRVKDKNLFLYQMNLDKYINLEFDDEEEEKSSYDITVPEIIEETGEVLDVEESIYDIQGITFDEINCEFAKEMTQGLSSQIAQRFMSKNKGIIVVKGKRKYQPRTVEVIEKINQNNIFESVHKITCYDDMKYKPYGFFSDFISGLYSYSTTGKLKAMNNYSSLKQFDTSGFIPDVINLTEREVQHPEDVRFGLFESFESLIPFLGKSLIIIEDIDKIDDTSYEILLNLLANFDRYNISYLITADSDFSLHKNAHFLLGRQEYTEITLKPTPIKTLLEVNKDLCKNVLNTFYMRKIAKNAKGSQMYFMQAIVHLMDLGIFVINKGSLELAKSETALFPTTLDELIQRRLLYVKTLDANLFKLFACILFIGPQLDLNSVQFFNNQKIEDYMKFLDMKGFVYLNNNNVLQVQNYNLYYDNILKLLTYEEKRAISNFLIMYFFKENSVHPILAKLYNFVENCKNEFVQWENLSNICRSLGDFSAYLNCSLQFLKVLSKNVTDITTKPVEEYKIEIYENIANLLYKYTPDKIANITQIILDNLEAGMNDKKVINLCNKIMQGCLISGKYNYALLMSHKILSRLENAGVNPSKPDFNVQSLIISLIKIEILFNVGDLEDCIVSGEELFNGLLNVNLDAIRPKTVSKQQFTDLLVDAICYIIFAKILQLKTDTYKFCETVEKIIPNLPESYKLFAELDNLLHGKKVTLLPEPPSNSDKFGGTLYYIIKAFNEYPNDPNNFAIEIYHAKLRAKESGLNQLELFCDVMIGKSYMDLDSNVKASAIISSVLETSQNDGLKNLFYISAYLTSLLSIKNEDLPTACGIISNQIVELEKGRNSCEYILMMYKLLYAKVLKMQKEETQANFCYNQAKLIAEQHSIKL